MSAIMDDERLRNWRAAAMPLPALEAGLRRATDGRWGRQAAVELLIADRYWLGRVELFVTMHLVSPFDDPEAVILIDWVRAVEVADKSPLAVGKVALLRLACSLAGAAPAASRDWSIESMLAPLSQQNTQRALAAILHAATGASGAT